MAMAVLTKENAKIICGVPKSTPSQIDYSSVCSIFWLFGLSFKRTQKYITITVHR